MSIKDLLNSNSVIKIENYFYGSNFCVVVNKDTSSDSRLNFELINLSKSKSFTTKKYNELSSEYKIVISSYLLSMIDDPEVTVTVDGTVLNRDDQLDVSVYFTQYHLGGYGISDEDGYFYCEECGDADMSIGPLSTLSDLKDTFLDVITFGFKVKLDDDDDDDQDDLSPYSYEELAEKYKELVDDYNGKSSIVNNSSLSKEDVELFNDSFHE